MHGVRIDDDDDEDEDKEDVGVGRLPAVSNRIMEIREATVGVPFIWWPICFK